MVHVIKIKSDSYTTVYLTWKTSINLIKIYRYLTRRHQIYATEDAMAPSAIPFEPSYTVLKNLRQKVHKHTTTSVNLSLPIRPQDLSTDSTPYLDGAIGILSNSTAVLYNNNAP